MLRYAIELAYDGTNYHGWQMQPDSVSVQETLSKAFSMILRETVTVVGCGRTDTGVHAKHFVAHVDVSNPIENTDKLAFKLNSFLANDIAIFSIKEAKTDFHARFGATSRSYEYHLITQKSPFKEAYAYRPYFDLDFEAMNKAALELLKYTDFTSFSKLHTDTHTNDCDVTFAKWEHVENNHWVFHISANRFLRNMVRAIVGTLLEVGKGKINHEQFCQVIEKKNRGAAGISVPGKALFLTKIVYPD